MENFVDKLRRNRYFLLFIVLFAYAQSIDSRIRQWTELNFYTFTPDAAMGTLTAVCILFLVLTFFVRHLQKSDAFSTKELVKIFISSLVSYIILMQSFSFLIAVIFGNVERNFSGEILMLTTFNYLLDGFIYGSFFLAYSYYNKNKRIQDQMTAYDRALSKSKIYQLKAQLNPHFLFNNLNVLDQLIEEDKNKASDFLNEFADIYRFVLQVSDKKTISINEELTFVKQYFSLIKHKYGNAYQLTIEGRHHHGLIVPLTLQLMIENAVQHNLGTESNPVYIKILLGEHILVSNNLRLKRNEKSESGRALENLREQYSLLSNTTIEIRKVDNTFSVIIPIIQMTENQ